MTLRGFFCAAAASFTFLLAAPCFGQEQQPAPFGSTKLLGNDVFKVPALAQGLRRVSALIEDGDLKRAVAELEKLVSAFPEASVLRTLQGSLSGTSDPNTIGQAPSETEQILAEFAAPLPAVCPPAANETGTSGETMTRPDALGSGSVRPDAAVVSAGRAPVRASNTVWDPRVQRLRSQFVFPRILDLRPVAPREGKVQLGGLPAAVRRQLQEWYLRGTASGLAGVLYDNRDRGHSRLARELWPQLSLTDYDAQAQSAGVDYGLNTQILFDAITIGNSSTALTGRALWRSQPRLAMTSSLGAARLYQLYANNHLYVFPEHRDHDPVSEGGRGDVLPANTPYVLISQGSSGSDRPFLGALAAILAAYTPETKAFLTRHRLVAPTTQMVFRRSLKGVADSESYMSAAAHPSVFRAEDIDLMRLIRTAHAIAARDIPPVPCLKVVRETHPRPRLDVYGDGLSEVLFDTPSAIARSWRSIVPMRTMTVSAAATRDPNGRPLKFRWRVLLGDPERIEIVPVDEKFATVEISIGWHERRPVPGRPGLTTDRVDIAVFADNGRELSAPGFVSILFPADQQREYMELPSGVLRVESVDYSGAERQTRYADPLIFPRRDWRDQYIYDSKGNMLGWQREQPGMPTEMFTQFGHRVITRDQKGRPERAEGIAYPIRRGKDGSLSVDQVATGRTYAYAYLAPDSRLGIGVLEHTSNFGD